MAKRSKIERKVLIGATFLFLLEAIIFGGTHIANRELERYYPPEKYVSQKYTNQYVYDKAPIIENQD